TNGVFFCGTDTTGSTFSYPFPSNATTTSLAFNGGLTFTQATGTNIYASASSTFQNVNLGAITIPSLTSTGLAVNTSGVVYGAATTTAGTGLSYANGQFA